MRERRVPACAWLALVLLFPSARVSAGQQTANGSAPARTEAVGLIERGEWPAARLALADALRKWPDDPALHNLAGVVEAQLGAPVAAEAHFAAAIRLAPHAVPAHENLARLYQEQAGANPDARGKALDTYRRLLAIDPANLEATYQSAFLLVLDGQFAAAREQARRLPADVRQRPQVLAVLAAAAAGSGDGNEARMLAGQLSSHPELQAADVAAVLPALDQASAEDLAAELLAALDRRGLATPDMLAHLGALHLQARRFADARAVLERAADRRRPAVALLLNLARAAYQLHDHRGALGYLAHARSLEPHNATVHFLFGMVCVEQDLGREAYDSLKKAVELDPENPMINYAMGAVATHRHEPSEALPFFEKYVRLRPADPRGRFALGAARFYAHQFERARADLELAALSDETATGAHYFLARIARQANDLPAARREIEAALRRTPSYADAWAELGLVQIRTGEYEGAEQSLQRALALEPDNYQAAVNLATLYGRTKDPRRAQQEAKVATLLDARAVRAQEFLRIVEVVP